MGTGTLETMGTAALPQRTPTGRRPAVRERAWRTLAVAETLGLAALFALGSLPYLVKSRLGVRPRRI